MFERSIVTLDFDGSTVRMLSLRRGRVQRWDSLTLAPELMNQGLIQDVQQVGAALVSILDRNAVNARTVVCSVTGMRTISRLLTLPSLKSSLVEGAIHHKLKQEIPLSFEETDLSWEVVSRSPQQLEVYVQAVPRESIDRLVEALRIAGLRARALEVKPLALARLVEPSEAVIVNLEDHSLAVVILVDQLPVIVRTVPFTDARTTSEAKLDLLVSEVARTVKFHNEANKDRPLEPQAPVVVTGAQFEAPDLFRAFTAQISGAVQVPSSPFPHPKGFPIMAFSVNLGLALKKG